MNHILKNITLRAALPLLLLFLWQLGSRQHWWSPYILPPPASVWQALTQLAASGQLAHHIAVSLVRVAAGFAIAAATALPLGILLGLSRPAHAACQLVLEFFRNVPPLALLPMLILWFGIGESSKLIIVILATFFPIFLNTLAAISRPNAGLLELAQVFRLSPGAAFWHLRLPMAMPAIYTGLRIGLGYSWRSLIGAEMIAAAAGLGWLILDGEEMARPDVVLAGIFVLGLLGILTDAAIRALGRRCWRFTGGE